MNKQTTTKEESKHAQLSRTAIHWLYYRGCSVFANEVPTKNGIADALGIITRDKKHTIYYIEAKASRSDLIGQKQKCVYIRSIGKMKEYCNLHNWNTEKYKSVDCDECKQISFNSDTGIDFYYFIVADGVCVEKELYPEWGVIDENGKVVRKAKRRKREKDTKWLMENIAHVLVYKVFGKLYI